MKKRPARKNKVKGVLTLSDGKAVVDDRNDKKQSPHCPLGNNSHDLDVEISAKWKERGGANSYLNRSYVMGPMKRYRNHKMQEIVQIEEPARYLLENTQLIFMASR